MTGARERLGPATRALVTGGGGFLGQAIVTQLLERGVRVRSYARGPYPELERRGVEVIRGDLRDREGLRRACDGQHLVFHVAAKAGIWGPPAEFGAINFEGTRNVVEGCRAAGVERLVYTSTPSVVFDGVDLEGVAESVPYARGAHSPYVRSKALAEKWVLEADGVGLHTVALRPHLVWGPRDPHFLPRIVARARSGRLRMIGNGSNRVDTLYIDNAARAHLLAAERVGPGSPAAGRAYFLSQGEPRPLWEMIDRLLQAAGEPPVRGRIPAGVAYAAAAVLEGAYGLLRIRSEPLLTRFLVRELSTSHWFDISAARKDLGYEPVVGIEEGLRRVAAWLRTRPVSAPAESSTPVDRPGSG